MNLNLKSNAVIFAIALVLTVFFVAELVEARGRGGGGRGGGGGRSFSHSGVAGGGGFSHNRQHVSNPRTRPVSRDHQRGQDRDRDDIQEARDDRQEARKDRQEDRQDFIEDEHDDYWDDHRYGHGYGYGYGSSTVIVVGGAAAAAGTTYRTTLPCRTSAVVVNGVSYYNCSSTWYQRGYAGDQVSYIAVDSPAGY